MWKTTEGSTGRLLQLCAGYFLAYVVYGTAVKYFQDAAPGYPGMKELEFLLYSTAGGTVVCLGWAILRGWYRLKATTGEVQWGPLRFPRELLYIVPSGVCTAVVIPTTTLMYTLPISVMVAMVIMRGSVIVISRLVDAIQIQRGILKKTVYWEENAAVIFALLAMSVNLFWEREKASFDFTGSPAAMAILLAYVSSYFARIYIMNYYKNTRPPGAKLDNNAFFAIEQISAFVTLVLTVAVLLSLPRFGYAAGGVVGTLQAALAAPKPTWPGAVVAGAVFGVSAFFSVFLFMFKGRTATFAGLVNRLTSLVAGTASTLLFAVVYGGKYPKPQDWASLGFILVAVAFLTRAERRRAAALLAAHEIEATPLAPRAERA
ncbi:MAG TPA: hypothetical protein VG389_10835 [Myxococcota bacterium]|nr:hypothetical protein [Myxococcota bacterium]